MLQGDLQGSLSPTFKLKTQVGWPLAPQTSDDTPSLHKGLPPFSPFVTKALLRHRYMGVTPERKTDPVCCVGKPWVWTTLLHHHHFDVALQKPVTSQRRGQQAKHTATTGKPCPTIGIPCKAQGHWPWSIKITISSSRTGPPIPLPQRSSSSNHAGRPGGTAT